MVKGEAALLLVLFVASVVAQIEDPVSSLVFTKRPFQNLPRVYYSTGAPNWVVIVDNYVDSYNSDVNRTLFGTVRINPNPLYAKEGLEFEAEILGFTPFTGRNYFLALMREESGMKATVFLLFTISSSGIIDVLDRQPVSRSIGNVFNLAPDAIYLDSVYLFSENAYLNITVNSDRKLVIQTYKWTAPNEVVGYSRMAVSFMANKSFVDFDPNDIQGRIAQVNSKGAVKYAQQKSVTALSLGDGTVRGVAARFVSQTATFVSSYNFEDLTEGTAQVEVPTGMCWPRTLVYGNRNLFCGTGPSLGATGMSQVQVDATGKPIARYLYPFPKSIFGTYQSVLGIVVTPGHIIAFVESGSAQTLYKMPYKN